LEDSLIYHRNAEEMAEFSRDELKKQTQKIDPKNSAFELPGIKNHIGLIYLKKGLYLEAEKEFEIGLENALELKKIEALPIEPDAKLNNVIIRLKKSKIEKLQLSLDWSSVETGLIDLLQQVPLILPDSSNYDPIYSRLNTRIHANLSLMLATFYMNKSKIEKAKTLIDTAETVGNALDDIEIKRLVIFKKAQIQYLLGADKEASNFLQDPLFQPKGEGGLLENKNDIIEYYLFLAELYANQNKFKESFQLLIKTQEEIGSNGYYIDFIKLFVLITKFSIEDGRFENAEKVINFLIARYSRIDQGIIGGSNQILSLNDVLTNISKELIKNPSIDLDFINRKNTIQRISDFLRQLYNRINLINFKFNEKTQNDYLPLLIQSSILFFTTLYSLPEMYETFKSRWYNVYKKKFSKISESSLEELIAIKYNELNVKRYEDCILKIYNIVEIELYHYFINPVKNILKNQNYNLGRYDPEKDRYFLQFRAFIIRENEGLNFIVIEKFILYLTGLYQDEWMDSWNGLLSMVNNHISEQDMTRLKTVAGFLKNNWSTTLGMKNFREIRNTIVHNVKRTLSKQEFESLFFDFKKIILDEIDIKGDNSNQNLQLLRELTNITILEEK
jgi:hypothetical protein